MKYKFYEESPELPHEVCGVWTDEPEKYIKEINWVAKGLGLEVNKFRVDDMTFGDPVLFYQNKYMGYLDNLFYRAFDVYDFEGWWGFDN